MLAIQEEYSGVYFGTTIGETEGVAISGLMVSVRHAPSDRRTPQPVGLATDASLKQPS